jgi:hypothetical protein
MTANKPVSLYVRSCLDKKRKENKMTVKKYIQLCLISLLILIIFSCDEFFIGEDGADGEDGRAAIAYSWMGYIWNVWSNDPTIPSIFSNGTYYYYAEPGTYSYSYSGDGGSWTGNYTIWIEQGEDGEPGELFLDGEDGDDGEDMCFELYMFSYIGPSFYEWDCSYEDIVLPRTTSNSNSENNGRFEIDLNDEIKNYDNEDQVITEEKLVKLKKDTFDEFDFGNSIDENPNTVTESGKIGKFHFIHKYVKVE